MASSTMPEDEDIMQKMKEFGGGGGIIRGMCIYRTLSRVAEN
jgi:hypothetical protein